MELVFRQAVMDDLPKIMVMVEAAKKNLKERGVSQWQRGDPTEEGMREEIEKGRLYVLDEGGKAVGMIVLAEGDDPCYEGSEGVWLNNDRYCAFHRICVDQERKGRGLAGKLIANTEELARERGYRNVRIDTHPDNDYMQHALEKAGYTRCGTIILASGNEAGDPRFAYQKILE